MPVTALGSPGGDQQDQWQLLYLLRTIVGGYTPQAAIDAPALHTTSLAGVVLAAHLGAGGRRRRGPSRRRGDRGARGARPRVTRAGDWTLGRLSSVGRDRERGILTAAANPRGAQGYAAGR